MQKALNHNDNMDFMWKGRKVKEDSSKLKTIQMAKMGLEKDIQQCEENMKNIWNYAI